MPHETSAVLTIDSNLNKRAPPKPSMTPPTRSPHVRQARQVRPQNKRRPSQDQPLDTTNNILFSNGHNNSTLGRKPRAASVTNPRRLNPTTTSPLPILSAAAAAMIPRHVRSSTTVLPTLHLEGEQLYALHRTVGLPYVSRSSLSSLNGVAHINQSGDYFGRPTQFPGAIPRGRVFNGGGPVMLDDDGQMPAKHPNNIEPGGATRFHQISSPPISTVDAIGPRQHSRTVTDSLHYYHHQNQQQFYQQQTPSPTTATMSQQQQQQQQQHHQRLSPYSLRYQQAAGTASSSIGCSSSSSPPISNAAALMAMPAYNAHQRQQQQRLSGGGGGGPTTPYLMSTLERADFVEWAAPEEPSSSIAVAVPPFSRHWSSSQTAAHQTAADLRLKRLSHNSNEGGDDFSRNFVVTGNRNARYTDSGRQTAGSGNTSAFRGGKAKVMGQQHPQQTPPPKTTGPADQKNRKRTAATTAPLSSASSGFLALPPLSVLKALVSRATAAATALTIDRPKEDPSAVPSECQQASLSSSRGSSGSSSSRSSYLSQHSSAVIRQSRSATDIPLSQRRRHVEVSTSSTNSSEVVRSPKGAQEFRQTTGDLTTASQQCRTGNRNVMPSFDNYHQKSELHRGVECGPMRGVGVLPSDQNGLNDGAVPTSSSPLSSQTAGQPGVLHQHHHTRRHSTAMIFKPSINSSSQLPPNILLPQKYRFVQHPHGQRQNNNHDYEGPNDESFLHGQKQMTRSCRGPFEMAADRRVDYKASTFWRPIVGDLQSSQQAAALGEAEVTLRPLTPCRRGRQSKDFVAQSLSVADSDQSDTKNPPDATASSTLSEDPSEVAPPLKEAENGDGSPIPNAAADEASFFCSGVFDATVKPTSTTANSKSEASDAALTALEGSNVLPSTAPSKSSTAATSDCLKLNGDLISLAEVGSENAKAAGSDQRGDMNNGTRVNNHNSSGGSNDCSGRCNATHPSSSPHRRPLEGIRPTLDHLLLNSHPQCSSAPTIVNTPHSSCANATVATSTPSTSTAAATTTAEVSNAGNHVDNDNTEPNVEIESDDFCHTGDKTMALHEARHVCTPTGSVEVINKERLRHTKTTPALVSPVPAPPRRDSRHFDSSSITTNGRLEDSFIRIENSDNILSQQQHPLQQLHHPDLSDPALKSISSPNVDSHQKLTTSRRQYRHSGTTTSHTTQKLPVTESGVSRHLEAASSSHPSTTSPGEPLHSSQRPPSSSPPSAHSSTVQSTEKPSTISKSSVPNSHDRGDISDSLKVRVSRYPRVVVLDNESHSQHEQSRLNQKGENGGSGQTRATTVSTAATSPRTLESVVSQNAATQTAQPTLPNMSTTSLSTKGCSPLCQLLSQSTRTVYDPMNSRSGNFDGDDEGRVLEDKQTSTESLSLATCQLPLYSIGPVAGSITSTAIGTSPRDFHPTLADMNNKSPYKNERQQSLSLRCSVGIAINKGGVGSKETREIGIQIRKRESLVNQGVMTVETGDDLGKIYKNNNSTLILKSQEALKPVQLTIAYGVQHVERSKHVKLSTWSEVIQMVHIPTIAVDDIEDSIKTARIANPDVEHSYQCSTPFRASVSLSLIAGQTISIPSAESQLLEQQPQRLSQDCHLEFPSSESQKATDSVQSSVSNLKSLAFPTRHSTPQLPTLLQLPRGLKSTDLTTVVSASADDTDMKLSGGGDKHQNSGAVSSASPSGVKVEDLVQTDVDTSSTAVGSLLPRRPQHLHIQKTDNLSQRYQKGSVLWTGDAKEVKMESHQQVEEVCKSRESDLVQILSSRSNQSGLKRALTGPQVGVFTTPGGTKYCYAKMQSDGSIGTEVGVEDDDEIQLLEQLNPTCYSTKTADDYPTNAIAANIKRSKDDIEVLQSSISPLQTYDIQDDTSDHQPIFIGGQIRRWGSLNRTMPKRQNDISLSGSRSHRLSELKNIDSGSLTFTSSHRRAVLHPVDTPNRLQGLRPHLVLPHPPCNMTGNINHRSNQNNFSENIDSNDSLSKRHLKDRLSSTDSTFGAQGVANDYHHHNYNQPEAGALDCGSTEGMRADPMPAGMAVKASSMSRVTSGNGSMVPTTSSFEYQLSERRGNRDLYEGYNGGGCNSGRVARRPSGGSFTPSASTSRFAASTIASEARFSSRKGGKPSNKEDLPTSSASSSSVFMTPYNHIKDHQQNYNNATFSNNNNQLPLSHRCIQSLDGSSILRQSSHQQRQLSGSGAVVSSGSSRLSQLRLPGGTGGLSAAGPVRRVVSNNQPSITTSSSSNNYGSVERRYEDHSRLPVRGTSQISDTAFNGSVNKGGEDNGYGTQSGSGMIRKKPPADDRYSFSFGEVSEFYDSRPDQQTNRSGEFSSCYEEGTPQCRAALRGSRDFTASRVRVSNNLDLTEPRSCRASFRRSGEVLQRQSGIRTGRRQSEAIVSQRSPYRERPDFSLTLRR